jgi:hypothetical protein
LVRVRPEAHGVKTKNAKVAQLVEHDLAKVRVAGSNPVFRSSQLNAKVSLFLQNRVELQWQERRIPWITPFLYLYYPKNIKIMETFSFTLGVLAVIDLMIVVGTFFVLKTLNITRKQAEKTQRELDSNIRSLHFEVERYRNDLYERISNVEKQVVQHTDSRVDKLENKVYKDFDLYRKQGKNY